MCMFDPGADVDSICHAKEDFVGTLVSHLVPHLVLMILNLVVLMLSLSDFR